MDTIVPIAQDNIILMVFTLYNDVRVIYFPFSSLKELRNVVFGRGTQ